MPFSRRCFPLYVTVFFERDFFNGFSGTHPTPVHFQHVARSFWCSSPRRHSSGSPTLSFSSSSLFSPWCCEVSFPFFNPPCELLNFQVRPNLSLSPPPSSSPKFLRLCCTPQLHANTSFPQPLLSFQLSLPPPGFSWAHPPSVQSSRTSFKYVRHRLPHQFSFPAIQNATVPSPAQQSR